MTVGAAPPTPCAPSERAHKAARAASSLAATVLVATLLGMAATAVAAPPPPADLRVEGGEETWQPKRSFRVVWANPSTGGEPAIAAVHYRLRDPDGVAIQDAQRLGWAATSIEGLEVPARPGTYTVEVRLEDAAGAVGAAAAAKLRFDNARPGNVVPLVAGSWIGRAAFPIAIRLTHPTGEPPLSGIRGYALSVSPTPGKAPCEAVDRCSVAETDLRGGTTADSYVLADLPEGTSHVEAVAVSGSGMASETAGGAVLRVDKTSPTTRLHGVPAGWTDRPVRLAATAVDAGSGMQPQSGGLLPYTAIAIDGRAPIVATGGSVAASVLDEGVHGVAYYAGDLAGNVDDGATGYGRANPPPATTLVHIDRTPPEVSFANAQDSANPELIRARVADALSGPDPVRGWIGVRRGGSGDPFSPLPMAAAVRLPAGLDRPPSGPVLELRARWDSDSYPRGKYEFRALAYDVAGNAAATRRRADGTPMILSNPLKATTTLEAGLGGRGAANRSWLTAPALTVRFGRRVRLGGRLFAGASTPLRGAPVRVVERFAVGSGMADRVSSVTTGRGGIFAIQLAPGPSREVAVAFAGTPRLSRSASPALRLGVRSRVRLRVGSKTARVGGPPIVFRGRVDAAPGTIPPDGKSVQLQFRLPGLPWREFRTVHTDRRGRFRYAYRFSDDDSRGVRFRFRARAPAQANWAYEPASSRPLAVRGR